MTLKMPPGIERAPFDEVARLIAGDTAPEWLVGYLVEWRHSLAIDIFVHEVQPTKASLRPLLLEVQRSAKYLFDALQNNSTREFLESEPLGPMPYFGALTHMLTNLADRAERAANSRALVNNAGKTKSGQGKALPPAAISPQDFCAAVVLEAWSFFHERPPSPRNSNLAKAAEAYWKAVGGPKRRSWGRKRQSSWRSQFEKVRGPAAAKIRADIRHHLEMSAQPAAIDQVEERAKR